MDVQMKLKLKKEVCWNKHKLSIYIHTQKHINPTTQKYVKYRVLILSIQNPEI